MIRLRDPVVALDFDLAAAARLLERERQTLNEWSEETLERPREIFW